ncbi:MAG: primosomal protein N' [Burkholderiales bacterium]
MNIARVLLDVPLAQAFDYRLADADESDVGCLVVVPFGKRTATGVIAETPEASEVDPARLKPVVRVLREGPRLSKHDMRLLRFAAEYYQYPLGQAILGALPLRLRRAGTARPARPSGYALTTLGAATPVESLPAKAAVKRRLLCELKAHGALTAEHVRRIAPSARAVLNEFIAAGWVKAGDVRPLHTHPPSGPAPEPPHSPTAAQARAIDAICAKTVRFAAFLLLGVTGSGKTEVYLRVAASVLQRHSQVLMLVPEIALTPQLEAMVQARFPQTRLVSLHSGLNETERLENWLAARSGEARIVLGTRLAVFAPLPELGLIVVDEEHDASLKQTEGFCYSARDMAVARAHQLGVPVVLGSATPSLESYHNAKSGRYEFLELPERVNARPPNIACLVLDRRRTIDGLSPELLAAISQRLSRKEQTLVFINRRGYAPVLTCRHCGWFSACHRCSAQLVLHQPERRLHCHHCGHQSRVPPACPKCGEPNLTPLGQGTQRVEEALARHFPLAKVLRIDRDSTRRKNAFSEMRGRIRSREVDILVGTQILAKGHDFPHLALVGVLNADSMLYSADFRAAERLYALLVQVAGRAGRGDALGQVLIQTEFPDHPLYEALRSQDVTQFAERLLAERRQAGFPPFVHQALLRAEAREVGTALDFLESAKSLGRALGGNVQLFDPVPALMVKLAGRERAQLLVQSGSRSDLHEFLKAWRSRLAEQKSSPARWMLEVDPLEL